MSSTILDPSTTIQSLQETLSLDARLVKALIQRLGLRRPTLVQAQVWPLVLQQGRSCLVRAPTGSGKTLAYAVPVLQKILNGEHNESSDAASMQALILVPTRELCTQVQQVLQQACHYCSDLQIAILSVGHARGTQQQAEQARQLAALRDNPALVVATPAACAHAMRTITTKNPWQSIRTVILDEADLVLSLGHEPDLRHIVQTLPRLYQGLVVSATLNPDVQALKGWMLLDQPVVVKVEDDETPTIVPQLKQLYLPVKSTDKYLVLYVFLKLGLLQGKGLFFVASTDAGYRLKLFLQLFHIRAAVLNAELPVHSRLHIIQQFHLGVVDYLIATDASANEPESGDKNDDEDDKESPQKKSKRTDSEYGVSRGVDFHKVSFVVNVDFPPNPTVYRHRIGRTARGGRAGVALSLVSTDPPKAPTLSKKKHSKQNTTTFAVPEWELLQAVQEDQPRIPLVHAAAQTQGIMQAAAAPRTEDGDTALMGDNSQADQAQPVLLDFDLQEIEGFRYRVEDVSRAVTRKAVQEARASELKAEILNSERLQQHFAENPADAKLLQHDRPSAALHAPDHLKHVPKYLLPKGMQVANLNRKRKRKKRNKFNDRISKDPLQSFQADVTLDGVAGIDEDGYDQDDDEAVEMNDSPQKSSESNRIFANTHDGTGKSTAGRVAWKERHRKGKYSNKKRKSERRSEPLGI